MAVVINELVIRGTVQDTSDERRTPRESARLRVEEREALVQACVEAVLQAAEETGAIVTAENNMYFGGLGSAVAEVLVENHPIPMKRIGVRDEFAESGPYLDLLKKYGLSSEHIARAVEEVIERKT